jgi:short-chain fatty acids transporter
MKKLMNSFAKICESFIPDAFIFCLLLTLIVFGLSSFFTPHTGRELVGLWGREFWNLGQFSMQMIFVLVTGQVLASTKLVNFCLQIFIKKMHHPGIALVLVSLISLLTCWLNWGLGLMISAILAIEVGKKIKTLHFPLLVATAYSGFIIWHAGLSGSIPLKIAGKDDILQRYFPDLSFPLDETIFSSFNIAIVLTLFFVFPVTAFILWKLVPSEEKSFELKEEEFSPDVEIKLWSFENGPFLTLIIGSLFLVNLLVDKSPFDINKMNFLFLTLAFIFHGTPRRFLNSFQKAFKNSSGIAIQFPFYAGMMGMMQSSGLVEIFSQFIMDLSTPSTFPLLSFLSAGVVNIFIPSGGGQWVVQGPVLLKVAKDMALDPAKISMAIAWGDAWTNLIQPFWAIPILSLASLRLKDIIGYCFIYLLVSGVVISAFFMWF